MIHKFQGLDVRDSVTPPPPPPSSPMRDVNPIETIVATGDRIPFGTMGAYLRRKQRLYSDSRNFFVLRPLVLRVVSFESVYSALSDDVWYCSGWYWKFLRNIDLKSRHVKCVRSAWPECGSLRQLYNVCVYGAGSLRQLFNVCALWSYNLSRVFSFPR